MPKGTIYLYYYVKNLFFFYITTMNTSYIMVSLKYYYIDKIFFDLVY